MVADVFTSPEIEFVYISKNIFVTQRAEDIRIKQDLCW